MNKKTLLSLMMLCFAFFGVARADELTVHDGTATSGYIPMYGGYFDDFTKSEFVFPASDLAVMSGGTITGMKFYVSSVSTGGSGWNSIQQVFVKEVASPTLSAYGGPTDATVVWEGSLTCPTGPGELEITFSTPYTYYGGNLLVGVYNTTDNSYRFVYFYGENVNGASGAGSNGTSLADVSFTQRDFLPKTTFTYVNCATPTGLTVSNVTSTTATLNWTENGDSESWYIFYQEIPHSSTPVGPTPPTPPTPPGPHSGYTFSIEVTENPYTLTGLEPNTCYSAFVVPSCGVSVEFDDYYYDYSLTSNTVQFIAADRLTIGSGTGTNSYLPTTNYYNYNLSQQIYTTEELGTVGAIESIEFYCTGSPTRYLDIYMVSTDKTSFENNSDWISVSQSDLVFSGTVNFANSAWTNITLTNPFIYDGINNVALIVVDYTGSYGTSIPFYVFDATRQAIRACNDITSYDASNPTQYTGSVLNVKNQIRFTKSELGDCVQPLRFTADEVGPFLATLSWIEVGASESWYIYYREAATTSYVEYDTIQVTENPFTLTNLEPYTSYEAFVIPSCGVMYGDPNNELMSDIIDFTTLESCPTPQNVAVTNITDSQATVAWSDYNEAYQVLLGSLSDNTETLLNESFDNGFNDDNWSIDPTYPWTVVDGHLQSGNAGVANSTSSISLSMYLDGPGIVEFDAECRGEGTSTYWDHCDFFIDNERVFYHGADLTNAGWNHYSFNVTTGYHTFTWSYTKDNTTNPTGDYFAIDNVVVSINEFEWGEPIEVLDPSYTFTGLDPFTEYYVQVQGICGLNAPRPTVTSWSELVSFSTLGYYNVTVGVDPNDAGTVTGGGTIYSGDTCTVTATPNPGYQFYYWTINNTVVSYDPTYSFPVTDNVNLVANFGQLEYYPWVTIVPEDAGWAEYYGGDGQGILYGEEITLVAMPNNGYRFLSWYVVNMDGEPLFVSDQDSLTFIMNSTFLDGFLDSYYGGEIEFIANFGAHFEVNASANPTAGGTVSIGEVTFDFENSTMQGWTTIDADYDGYNWILASEAMGTGTGHNGSTDMVMSQSFNNAVGALYPDNYLISPQVQLGGSISFWACAQDANYAAEHFGVAVSTTNNASPTAFTMIQEWTIDGRGVSGPREGTRGNREQSNWNLYTVDLSNYAGQIGYVAIRHFNTSDQYVLDVDDITLVPGGGSTSVCTFLPNQQCIVNATPATGYHFTNWTENGNEVSTDANYTFTVTADRNLVANFSANSYTISASTSIAGAGTISGAGSYNYGASCTLGVTPAAGYTFLNWTKDDGTVVSTNLSFTFTVTESASYVANFSQNSYAITVTANPTEGGTVTGGGTYNHGQNITLTATPNEGYTFTNWTVNGNVVSTRPNYSFIVTGARTLVANFSQNSYAITVTANPTEGGTVTGGGTYNHGQNITLTATPNEGYTFTGWSDGVTTNPRMVTVTGSATYVANFELQSFNITVSAEPTEGGTVSGGGTYNYGTSATLTATPASGYAFINWTKNGTVVSTNATYILNVTEGGTYVAHFSQNSYTLTINYKFADGTNAAPTHTENVSYGTSYSVTSPTITGYTPDIPVVSGTMGAEDITVDVTYNVNSYMLTINYMYPDGSIAAPTHTENVDYGASYSVTSPTIAGYTPNLPVVSGTMGAEDVTVNVTYSDNSYTLTINYMYADGSNAAPTYTENVSYGASYSITSPSITGYTPDIPVVSGTMGAEDITVDVTYNVNSYTLTINYKYANGTMAAPTHSENLDYGASYNITSPSITGYTPNLPVVSGTMGAEDVTVDVTYNVNSYTLTINYKYVNGTMAAPTHSESLDYGASYSVTSPTITGYTPSLPVVSGTMGAEDVTVDVTYSDNSYTLTINYKYANGTMAAPTYTENVSYGASYSVTSPAITGYTPDQAVVSGTMGAEDVTVDVTYNVNSYTLTINYKYANGTMAAPTYSESLEYGASYSVTSPTITGYTPNLPVVSGTMGAEDVTVDVTYSDNSYTLTINYKYANGTTAAPTHTENVSYGASYSVTSPTITGYTPDLAVVSGTMGAEDVTVDVTYSVNSYTLTINYKYADGSMAAPTHTESFDYGASYSVTSPTITGYTPDLAVVSGTMGAEDVTVDVTYSVNSYTLTINYKYADGSMAAPTHTESLDYGASYSVTSPTITGYTPNLPVVSGTMGAEDVSVDVTYNVNSYTLTINYKYANGTMAAPTHIESLDYGASYSVTSPAITGYTPNLPVVSGTMGAEDVTVDVTYSVNSYTLTINYKYADGTMAAPTHTESLDYGASYSVTSPAITGYTPNLPVVSGTMGTEDVTVDVTYSVNSYTLTINYKYADGTMAAPTHTENLDYGAPYSVTSPTITGYTSDLAVVTGTMGTENVTVDVTYTINSYTLTVNYLYADGTTAAASHTESVNYNATYSVTSPAITGYTPDLAVVTGTMGTENVTVNVTYTINSYTLTVNYLYADGTTAAASHTESVNYNATYSVTSPTITGYTPDLAVVTGTMGTENVTVNVTYTINSYTLTVNYLYADGTTAAPTYTESVNYNASYSVTSPAITGYTPDLAVVTGTMGTENVTVNVTYTINSYTLTVNYKYTDGTTAAPTHTESVNYNASYSVTSPAITGYTPDLAVVTGTMGTENVTVDVTYTINSYIISASANPTVGGSVNGAGTYNHFETASLTATASTGYTFVNWTENGNVVSTSPTISFMVEGPRTLVANFQLNSYQITAIANPTVGGTATGTGIYYHFETCTLIATPNAYYEFTNWTKDNQVVSTDATYSFTVEGGGTYVAHFTRVSHQVTALADPTEGGSVSGAGNFTHGTYCTLTATASTGYTFSRWTKDGTVVSSNPSYSFPVMEDATYVAHFSLNMYMVTVSADPTEGGLVSGNGSYQYGNSCTVLAVPNPGYTFTNWTKNGIVVSNDEMYVFPVLENTNLVAHFSQDQYYIDVFVAPVAGGTASGNGYFTYGETCTLTATPNTGYAFVNWTKEGTVVSTNPSYSFSVTESGDYVANFAVARYTLTVLAEPAEGGNVHGGGTYDYGQVVTLRAVTHEGYEFINWTKDGASVSSNALYSVVVRGDAEYVAHFRPYVYEIKANTYPDNTGDIDGIGFYNYGETCTLTVTPHNGYEFINWTLDGQVVSDEESITFVVTEDRNYVAYLQSDGIAEQGGITVSLYPNPAKRKLNIEASEPINKLEIYTLNGALVCTMDNCSDKVVINVDTYATGTYMIRLTTDSAVEIRRFVKE